MHCMDGIDHMILGELRRNARIPFSALGRAVGLSTNATAARVRRLERDGVIAGWTIVETDPADEGGLEAIVDVRLSADVDYEHFTAAVGSIPSIREAIHMTGPWDYLLRARVRDPEALDALLRRLKRDCGVEQTQTRIALRRA